MHGRLLATLAVAALGGAGTMVVELAAVRLLAPWFGTSQVVWTNVIAVVLLGLAVGYVLGGRLCALPRPLARLSWTLAAAAAVTALLPALAPYAARAFLPAGLALHEAAPVTTWGSLAVSLLLFLAPALLLGTVAPLCVQAVHVGQATSAGRAGGLVLGASTLGSLAGVFATSHVLIPGLGLAGTYWTAALALGLGALLAAASARSRVVAPAALLAVGAGLGSLVGRGAPALGEGVVELARAESAYQSIRVVEDRSWEPPLRFLRVNEGFDSYQSAWAPERGLLPTGFYYNAFALPAWWSRATGTWRSCVLGLGAGTVWRVLDGASPAGLAWGHVGVELDPEVVRLGRRFLDLEESEDRRIVAGVDARLALRALEPPFELVVLDCYANQVEIPPHLASLEFLREVRASLAPEGWLAANVGGFGLDDPVVLAVADTAALAFESDVLLLRVPGSRNVALFARHGGELPLDAAGLPLAVPSEAFEAWQAPLRLPGSTRVVSPGEGRAAGRPVLRDGHAPLVALQRRSIEEGRRRLAAGLDP